jgi:hypothetical protein
LNAMHVKPLGNGASENTTTREKPNTGVTVIVELASEPTFGVIGVVAETTKSTKTRAAPAVLVKVPSKPLTVTK